MSDYSELVKWLRGQHDIHTLSSGRDPSKYASQFTQAADAIEAIEAIVRERDAARKATPDPLAHHKVQEEAASRFGFEPGHLQAAWRRGERSDPRELEWAIVDALAMGGWAVYPGDGVGCAAQIVIAQMKRAEKAERERDEARALGYREGLEKAAEMVAERDWQHEVGEGMELEMAASTIGEHVSGKIAAAIRALIPGYTTENVP